MIRSGGMMFDLERALVLGWDERPASSDERTVLTRLSDGVPAHSAVRAHWTIETQLHWVRDVG